MSDYNFLYTSDGSNFYDMNGVRAFGPPTNLGSVTPTISPVDIKNFLPNTEVNLDTSGLADYKFTPKLSLGQRANGYLKSNPGVNMAVQAAANVVGNVANRAITDGFHGKAADMANTVLSTAGGLVGGAIGGPFGAALGTVAGNVLGGVANRAIGYKTNDENIAAVKGNIAKQRAIGNQLQITNDNSTLVNAYNSASPLQFSRRDLGRDGWFSHKIEDMEKLFHNRQNYTTGLMNHGLVAGERRANIMNDDLTKKYNTVTYAYGGLLDYMNDMPAVNYDFMNSYLTSRNEKNNNNSKLTSPVAGLPNAFAIGGDLQTHGADWSTGSSHIDAGGTHEENPNQGVQVGVDNQGTPNLVEEGEVIYNDYVYSQRITLDNEAKERFNISKKKEITYADEAKVLEKEISERPNDPISKAGYDAQMQALAEEQERQKAEMQAQEAQEMFAQLSPEEQVALMQQMAGGQQEAPMDEQQAAQEQMAQEQMAAEQGIPQEAMTQEQPVMPQEGMAMPEQAQFSQEPVMDAYGGPINRFDEGGPKEKIRDAVLKALDIHTAEALQEWAKKNKLSGFDDYDKIDWEKAITEQAFLDALARGDSALAHAISNGKYDFGAFQPIADSKGKIQSISVGNWRTSGSKSRGSVKGLFKGWEGSGDDMWKEAIDNHLIDDTMTLKTIEEKLKTTDAYKKTTEWLKKSPDNMLAYLQAIKDDHDAPPEAVNYFMKDSKGNDRGWVTVDDKGKLHWKEGYTPKYEDIFGVVRDTYPGTYWHTHKDALRNPVTVNWLQKDDGTWEKVIGDVSDDWEKVSSYDWHGRDEDTNDYTYNYYRNPKAAAAATDKDVAKKDLKPKLRPEWPRYAGLFGPVAGLAMWSANVGRPRDFNYNLAPPVLTNYQPVGNYERYDPMNVFAPMVANNAKGLSTERYIRNNTSPLGAQWSAMIANNYAGQLANGELGQKAYLANVQARDAATKHNATIDQYNATAHDKTAQYNASTLNDYNKNLGQYEMQRHAINADNRNRWYNALYQMINEGFDGLTKLGIDNATHNTVAKLVASGAVGGGNENHPLLGDYLLTDNFG